jgi:tetratricopeptide (TPR) repeat protein
LARRGIDAAPADRPWVARFAWQASASTELLSGNYEEAIACYHRAIPLARQAGDPGQEAREQIALALALGYLGRTGDAEAALAAAAAVLRTAPTPTVEAFWDYAAGEILLDRSPGDALPMLERSRQAARRIGNRYLAAIAGLSAASGASRIGEPASFLAEYPELIDHFDRTGAWAQQWTTIRSLIEALAYVGKDEEAAVLHGAMAASSIAPPVIGGDAVRMAETVAGLQARMGVARWGRLQASGARLGDEHAVAYALAAARAAVRHRPAGDRSKVG